MYEDNVSRPSAYVAYSTTERVVGLMKLPLDGDPGKSMGLIAHPGKISR
jgi:cilia- and flagella-associated protein 251